MAATLAIRFGPRQVVSLGMALEAAGMLGVVRLLDSEMVGSELWPFLFVYGVGVGLASAQLTSVVLAEVPAAESGQASGMQSTFRQIGAAMGIALLGSIYVGALGSAADSQLAEIGGLTTGQRERIVNSTVDSAGFYVEALRYWTPDFEPVAAAVADAITEAASCDDGGTCLLGGRSRGESTAAGSRPDEATCRHPPGMRGAPNLRRALTDP